MKTITVIPGIIGVDAFLVEHTLTMNDVMLIHRLSNLKFYNTPDLARRWGVAEVFCRPEWAAEQRKRKPMLKPKGQKMAILED